MNKKTRKKNRSQILPIIILALLALVSLPFIYMNNIVKGDKILNNVSIGKINVSNLTKEEAKQALGQKFSFGNVTLNDAGVTYDYNLSENGFNYDIDKSVEDAFNVGRDGNVIQNALVAFGHSTGKKTDIPLDYNDDYAGLENWFNEIAQKANIDPVNPTISVSGAGIVVVPGVKGKIVDVEALKANVKQEIEKNSDGQDIVLDLPVKTVEPYIKEEQLSKINGIIGKYSTKYPTTDVARSMNVAVTAKKMNGILLMPGDQGSFMSHLGPVNEKAGFKAAKIIINNEYVDGIGGGVCQVSSTMYNALLRSGLDITARSNHTFPIGYVPLGLDATVADPAPDMKYKNNYPFPIYITNSAGGGYMTTTIYGNRELAKKVDITTEVLETIPSDVVYKDDPTLPEGKEVVDDNGHIGYKVVSYKTIDGKKTVIARSNYKMTPKIILRGTKKAEPGTEQAQQPKAMQATSNDPNSELHQSALPIF